MSTNKKPTFMLDISCCVTLNLDEIWPDGDAPEHPTAEDVAKVIREEGGPKNVFNDWGLDQDMRIDISGGGTYAVVES